MTTPPTARAKELFLDALERAGQDRRRFLDELRDNDPALHARVTSLLAAHEGAADEDAELPELIGAVRSSLVDELREPLGIEGRKLGDYELLEEVAAGASGVVFRARQVSLDRTVAVKVLRAGYLAGERAIERFRAEAEAVARLDDPQIVPIYEVGDSPYGPYFSMKWLEGGSLATAVSRFAGRPDRVAALIARVARAVHHAHQRGILHRDIKPSNILLDAEGEPYVADFGIAKRIDEGGDATGTADLVGTPAYMAPEQVRGEELSVATDVWALGAVLHELLAGLPAFAGGSITELFDRVRHGDPRPLPKGVPRDLGTIALKCLSKEPERRYASANALAVDLERWRNHEPILARPVSSHERLRLWARRQPLVAGLFAIVGTLVVALAIGATWASLRLSDQLERLARAEARSQERLRASLLAQARDRRHGRGDGRRERALEFIRQAAEIRPGPDLRDEAIASLAVFDVTLDREWERTGVGAIRSFDADLERYAVSPADGTGVRVHRVVDGAELLRLPDEDSIAWAMQFAPDGRTLACKYHGSRRSENPHFVLWSLETGAEIARIQGTADAFDFHGSGARILLGMESGRFYLVDTASGRTLRELELELRPYRIAFDPAGRRLAVSTYPEKTLILYSWPELETLLHLELGSTVYDMDWTRDGALLVFGSQDQHAHLLDTTTGEIVRSYSGHRSDVVQTRLSPDGRTVATTSWDNSSRLWDFETGDELLTMSVELLGFGRDGRLAFVTNETAGLWNVDPDRVRRTLHGHSGKSPVRLEFSPTGDLLASSGEDELILWDPGTGERLCTVLVDGLDEAFFHPDGRLFTAGEGIGVQAWRLPADRRELRDVRPAPERTLIEGSVRTASVSADGRILAAVQGEVIRLIRLDGSAPPKTIQGFRGCNWPRLDPDGRYLVCGNWQSPDVKVRVWDVSTGEALTDLCSEDGSVRATFAPDGKHLVTGSGPTYRVFRVDTWEEVRTLSRPIEVGSMPTHAGFGPDGTLLIEDVDSAVRLHALADGALIARFEPPEVVTAGPLALDPGGRFLAVGSANNRIELWDVAAVRRRLAELGVEDGGS